MGKRITAMTMTTTLLAHLLALKEATTSKLFLFNPNLYSLLLYQGCYIFSIPHGCDIFCCARGRLMGRNQLTKYVLLT